MKESTFQKKVLDYLSKRGGDWTKIHVSSYQLQGVPDILGCYKGRFIALELKQVGKKPTDLQNYKLDKIRQNGGIAMRLDNLDQLVKILDKIDDD